MSSPQEFNCVFCKETFDNKEDLQIHFRKHGDPNFNPNPKNYKPRQHINESASNAEKTKVASEMVSCDVCSEVFPTISKAITHKHKLHPNHDAKYFCPWCGKLFTMKHLYNKHVQSNHSEEEAKEMVNHSNQFQCDACVVTFYLPPAMLYHNKFFHRQDTEMSTIGHSKLQKVIQHELMPIYYCPFCGEEYISKVNLHKHMEDDHSDENQSPDEVLRCPLCDALFYHLDAYEIHLTLHSSEDVYREVNEMNKNIKDITEYTLESVPPMKEKVEELEDFEELLEVAMNPPEGENSSKRMKVKKHKKHKKSKKTITLDEFLNMNKDVFGEGLGDVQGIEEVPTRIVAKQLKRNIKQPLKTGTKLVSSDIEKLKRQGIVIKMKPGSNSSKIPKVSSNVIDNKVTVESSTLKIPSLILPEKKTSNDVLTKLLNQSNSQIKIMKKQSEPTLEETKSPIVPEQQILKDLGPNTSEQIEMNCDVPHGSTALNETGMDCKEDYNILSMKEHIEMSKSEKSQNNVFQANLNQSSRSEMKKDEEDLEVEGNVEENKEVAEFPGVEKLLKIINHTQPEPYIEENLEQKKIETDKTDMRSCSPKDLEKLKKLGNLIIKTTNSKNSNNSPNQFSPITKSCVNEQEDPLNVKPVSPNSIKQLGNVCLELDNSKIETPTMERDSSGHKSDKSQEELKNNDIAKNEDNFPLSILNINNKGSLSDIESNEQKESSFNKCAKISSVLKKLGNTLTIKPANQTSPLNREDDNCSNEAIHQTQNKPIVSSGDRSLDMVKNLNKNLTIKSISKSQTLKPQIETDECDIDNDLADKTELVNANVKEIHNMNPELLHSTFKNIGSGISIRSKNVDKHNVIVDHASENSMQNELKSITKINTIPKLVNPKVIKKSLISKEIDSDIEIYNIDDSDEEDVTPNQNDTESVQKVVSNVITNTSSSRTQNSHANAFKNFSKDLIIKSKNVSTVVKQESIQYDDGDPNVDKNKLDNISNNPEVKNVLKNLGKHISIKSRNSSPSILKNEENASQDSFNSSIEKDEDSNSCNKIAIREVTDDCDSNEVENDNNAVIEQPNYSEDENPQTEEADQGLLNSQSNLNTLNKTEPELEPSFMNTLKNISKNITVKSLNEKKTEIADSSKVDKVVSKEIALYDPNKSSDIQSSDSINKQIKKQVSRSNNIQQKSTISSNNSQEVTVKRFETKTVIQEITTTVTKTVRTVNQTVHMETQNSVHGIRPRAIGQTVHQPIHQKINAFQGVKVRHATPPAPRLRNPSNIIRPQMIPARPQQLSVRPSNTARLSRPRMPTKQVINNQTTMGKPLKISPNVNISATIKRPATEESGPFSCFKKPKESLIPVPDLPIPVSLDGTSESFSACQISKADFKLATTTVRGNTVVTSTQKKTEANFSSQQLNRVNNMSGVKIIKTSQAKQETQTVEKCEVNTNRMSTLAAIDKLQRQGLLIKKPRVDLPIEDKKCNYSDEET